MIPIKLSQLPQFSGDSSGSYIVINDANNAVTYIVNKESFFTASLFGTASYASSAGTASYIDAGGVVGLNLSRIASGSATASISPGLFNVNTNTNIQGNLTASNALFTGDITAQRLVVQTITSSVTYSSGSNIFGNQLTDLQQMTGSLRVTGSGNHWIVGGNVGIGTTGSTGFTLDVSGSVRISGSTNFGGVPNLLLTNRGVEYAANSAFLLFNDPNPRFQLLNTDIRSNYVAFSSSPGVPDVFIIRDNPNTLAIRNSAVSQSFRIYNTYTSLSNFERAKLEWTGSVFNIGTEQSGSGVARDLALQTSGSTRLFISSSGNIGIGTNTPSFRLDVSGSDILVNGARVGLGNGNISTNTALGVSALGSNTTGVSNTAIGNSALSASSTNNFNTAVGEQALRTLLSGAGNVALGYRALEQAAFFAGAGTSANNVAIGFNAGRTISTGTSNATVNNSIFIGSSTTPSASGETNQIVIGHSATGLGSNTTVLGNSSTTTTWLGGNLLVGTTTGSGYRAEISGSAISGSLNVNNTLYVSGSRVGIGTRTPSALLDVEGTTQMNTLQLYTPNAGGLTADITYDGSRFLLGGNVASGFGFSVRGQSAQVVGIDGVDESGLQYALQFFANSAERARITRTGNLLVGTTTNSGFRLDVSGSARVTNGMQVSSSLDVSGSIVASAPSTLARITATSIGGAGITITGNAGSGQPGITTTSGLIHIVPVINGTGGNEVLAIRKSAVGANIVNFQSNAGVVLSTITGDGSLALNKSSSNGTLDVSGSALISGSLTVTGSLNVNDTATFSKPYTNTSDLGIVVTSSIAGINLRPPTGRFSIISGYNTTNSTTFVTSTGTSNPSVAMMYFDHSTGNVGINQTLPGFRLDVNGTARVSGNTQITGSLLVTGSMTITSGSVTMPNRPAFRVSGSGLTGIPVNTILSGSAVAVDYNQGGHYNNTNGKFTAPIAGLYHVYFNSRTQTAGQQQVVIYKNTSIAQMMWETNADTGHFGVSSILNLAVNDTIEAKVTVGTIQFDGNDSWGAAYIG
jgi:hypothetical protein